MGDRHEASRILDRLEIFCIRQSGLENAEWISELVDVVRRGLHHGAPPATPERISRMQAAFSKAGGYNTPDAMRAVLDAVAQEEPVARDKPEPPQSRRLRESEGG